MCLCSEGEKDIASEGDETEDHKQNENHKESLDLLFTGLFAIRPIGSVALNLSQVVCPSNVFPRKVQREQGWENAKTHHEA